MVRGIDNVGMCTADPARLVAFYEKLGFSEAYRNERGIMIGVGMVQLFVFATKRSDARPTARELGLFSNPPGIDHVSLAVADIDMLCARLVQEGVAVAEPPADQPWGARMAGLKDPDGNNLYLLQRFQVPSEDDGDRLPGRRTIRPAG